tara:strand:- start:15276 stop:16262 length:987 start_codon:yes stop_codon:yes gene_type:complete
MNHTKLLNSILNTLFILQISIINESDNLMKLLVTGASGNIGTVLGNKLKEQNIPFIGIDASKQNYDNENFLQLDITDKKEIFKKKIILNEVDTLIHLASKIDTGSDVINKGIQSVDVNLKGTLNLLENLPKLKNILFTSSYMVYGIPKQNPITEDHLEDPHTIYGASKIITEKYLQVFAEKRGINLTIFRYMGIYGLLSHYASQAIHIFTKLIEDGKNPIIYGDGLQRRNHLFIDDAIDAILIWINNKTPGIFNIGGIDSPTNLDLISMISKKMNTKVNPIFKESQQHDFICDISLANSKLHFKPNIRIDEGLKKTIEGFIQRRGRSF